MMTQEDVLDVLELLPVWHLRAPQHVNIAASNTQTSEAAVLETVAFNATPQTALVEANASAAVEENAANVSSEYAEQTEVADVADETAETANVTNDSVYEKPLSLAEQIAAPTLEEATQYLVDYYQVDGYIFITASTTRSEAAMTLMRNMLRAMRLTLPAAQSMYLNALGTTDAKVVIAMGMMVSQALLEAQAPFDGLRGKVHSLAGKHVIVTYDAQYLLDNPQDKPQAWADLCLVMQTLKDLTH